MEQESEENIFIFPAGTFHHIHFHYRGIRMLYHKGFKISVSTVLPVTRYIPFLVMPAPWFVTDFTREDPG